MANYQLKKRNGDPIPSSGTGLSPTVIDSTSTDLNLIGQNTPDYGTALNENFIRLLENFSGSTPTNYPLVGQLWWDSSNNILRTYTGTVTGGQDFPGWKINTGATVSTLNAPPGDTSSKGGDLWFVSDTNALKVWTGNPTSGDGDGWKTIGALPPEFAGTVITSTKIYDTSGGGHQVLQVKVNNTVGAMFSGDLPFTTTQITGFSLVKPGLNFNASPSVNWKIGTQEQAALGGTIVERTSDGSINATNLNATAVNTSGTITAGSFVGTLSGNVAGYISAPGITAGTISVTNGISASTVTTTGGFNGTINTPSQPNITGLGNVVNLQTNGTTTFTGTTNLVGTGTLNGLPLATLSSGVVPPALGGTGVNNGSYTLTITGTSFINQNVAINSSPTLRGTNFNNIPNSALINQGITIGSTFVPLGSTYNPGSTVSGLSGTANQVIVSGATGSVTLSLPQSIATTSAVTFGSMNIGSASGATTGQIRASDNVIAFASSDIKFKENVRPIPNALATVLAIGGDLFDWTDAYVESKGGVDGYFVQKADFGVIAQKVKASFPLASRTREDGSLAVDYAKLSALAFAAIAELSEEIKELKAKLR